MILVSAPVPLDQIGFYNLLGLGWGFGTKGLGTGLDNITDYRCNCILGIMNDRDENSRVDLH